MDPTAAIASAEEVRAVSVKRFSGARLRLRRPLLRGPVRSRCRSEAIRDALELAAGGGVVSKIVASTGTSSTTP